MTERGDKVRRLSGVQRAHNDSMGRMFQGESKDSAGQGAAHSRENIALAPPNSDSVVENDNAGVVSNAESRPRQYSQPFLF